ncbi:ABC transporter G family member 23 like protein [Argiope bruennichi]|uniref:ABC transporter G family member 23 like protein n=1 Tax=Argiope bruennichi TaxID=94029 RepID=A0A8T0EW00_ARGBR|nr:ABC transporter G family member 23 like protein [Argiope bruennichi]
MALGYVEKGIIYGLLGPSGCGKTTLLRCIVGRHQPSSGTIKIFGKSPGHDDCTVPGPGVGFMPQELALYPEITMKETLTYFGRLYQMDRSAIKERISFLTSFLDIPDKNKLIKHLSGGQQRRVSFAVALIHKPPLLMLDEPTVGVDPLLRRSIWKHLQKLASTDSITIIITTHYVEEARQAHVVGLMRDGRLLAETNPEVLIDQYNALTLEDVFLKLCVKDSEAIEAASADELNNFDEEPVLVFFQVFVPVFQVIVFCLCVGGEPFDIPMAIVNQETDPSGKSNAFLQTISSTTFIQNNFEFLLSLNVNRRKLGSVERGENWGVLYIPETFTDSMINRYLEGIAVDNETIQNSTIKMYLDMTRKPYWKPLHPDFPEFMVQGLFSITYIMAVGLSAMAVIIEKKEGLLDRSWFAGVRSWEVMFSMLFSLFGSSHRVVIAVLLTGLEGMSYGLFISSIVNDENIAMMIAMGSFYPNLLLSGIIWPVEAMPYYLRQFSYCLPLTLIANSMRSILSRGWTITDHGIWDGFLVCLAWIFPVILIASLFFRYKK